MTPDTSKKGLVNSSRSTHTSVFRNFSRESPPLPLAGEAKARTCHRWRTSSAKRRSSCLPTTLHLLIVLTRLKTPHSSILSLFPLSHHRALFVWTSLGFWGDIFNIVASVIFLISQGLYYLSANDFAATTVIGFSSRFLSSSLFYLLSFFFSFFFLFLSFLPSFFIIHLIILLISRKTFLWCK